MAFPTITVRIAFGSDAMATTPTWDDVSGDVREFGIERGRQTELDRAEPGTAKIVLNNSSGDYAPENAGGPYYPDILPGKRVNVRATYNAVTYDIFTGFVETWRQGFAGDRDEVPIIIIEAADGLKNLRNFELNTSYSEEASGTRVGNVLDDLGWPAADRSIDAGQSAMQASGTLSNEAAMSHLEEVQTSEIGFTFVEGDNEATFHDRHKRLKAPYTTSQATYGDDPGELGYAAVEFEHMDGEIYNDVRIEPAGGTEQTASDATSQATYGVRTLSRDNLLMTTDNEAQDQANFLLSRYKDAVVRVRSITILPQADEANLYPDVLGLTLGDRITIRLNALSVDEDFHIEGSRHDVTPGFWETTWWVSSADAQSYWTLGVTGLGELGSATRLAY
jgi:hypothetical protein